MDPETENMQLITEVKELLLQMYENTLLIAFNNTIDRLDKKINF